jgi:hypothetical protein
LGLRESATVEIDAAAATATAGSSDSATLNGAIRRVRGGHPRRPGSKLTTADTRPLSTYSAYCGGDACR